MSRRRLLLLRWPLRGQRGEDNLLSYTSRYKYRPLEDPTKDIRIINLLPGKHREPLMVEIFHEALVCPTELPQQQESGRGRRERLTLSELRATFPADDDDDHWVYEVDGRFLFWSEAADAWSWRHPDEGFDHSLYEETECEVSDPRVPEFVALSYVWGSQADPETINVIEPLNTTAHLRGTTRQSIPAVPRGGCIPVTKNLATALRHLRHVKRPRRLWVDAVCINQDDLRERGEQVKRMADIYRLANRVLVWLGPKYGGSSGAMANLQFLGQHVASTGAGVTVTLQGVEKKPRGWVDGQSLPLSANSLDELGNLFRRQWFQRLWVVQEILLANEGRAVVQCGSDVITWIQMARALELLSWTLADDAKTRVLYTTLGFTSQLRSLRTEQNLRHVLDISWARNCGEPRDKVYAILGILPSGFAALTRVNYSPDVPIRETYKAFFLSHLQYTGRWELTGAELGSRGVGGPTWVPDWAGEMTACSRMGTLQFSSLGSRLAFSYRAPDVLEVRGLKCATVHACTDPVKSRDFARALSWPRVDRPSRPHPTGDSFVRAFAITVSSGWVSYRLSLKKFVGALELDAWLPQVRQAFFPDEEEGNEDDEPSSAPNSKQRLRDALDGSSLADAVFARCYVYARCLVSTDEGYIALAPMCTRPGDIIVVILGCQYPLVLRPQPNKAYQLVGHCFCYGLEAAIPFLGEIPETWAGELTIQTSSPYLPWYRFVNSQTRETTFEDPRLPPLVDWERITVEEALGRSRMIGDPEVPFYFRNKKTGEVMDSDPRMLPDALNGLLKARGLELETFTLV